MTKVQLILVDGMRPESLSASKSEYAAWLLENSLYTLKAKTVMPSVTLPCHMSLFHSVDPTRHGITTNIYMPQVRPIDGICERLKAAGRKSGIYFNWEQLRDLTRPGSMADAVFFAGSAYGYEEANRMVTEASCGKLNTLDFTFTYLGWVDEAGHAEGWMGEEYLRSVDESFKCIKRLIEAAPEDCITIIIADHGGHDRHHGTDMPEDMTIPVIFHGKGLKGEFEGEVSIKDIAPTIIKLLDAVPAPEWEGKVLL